MIRKYVCIGCNRRCMAECDGVEPGRCLIDGKQAFFLLEVEYDFEKAEAKDAKN